MKNKSLFDSFNNAIYGIVRAIKTEKNLKIHFTLAILALVIALFFDLNTVELLLLIFCIVLVIVAELFNTAIEAVVDLASSKKLHALAKRAKDIAAGAVFVTATNAVVVSYVLFYTKIPKDSWNVFEKIKHMPYYITLISITVVVGLTLALKALTGYKKLLRGGMPSGHSSISFAVATVIAFLSGNVLITSLSYFLAFLVAQSRVEGKIHSLIQAIAGALLGTLITVFIFQLFS